MPLTKTSNRSAKILYRTSGTFSHLSIGIAPAILVFFSIVVLAGCALTANPGTPGNTSLKLTTASLPTAHAGQAYFETLAIAGGTPPFSWSVSTGNLPTGVSLGTNNGALTGTPSKAGSFNFAIQVTDSSTTKQSASKTYSMTVMAAVTPVSITTTSVASGQVGSAYSAALAASGGTTPYSWSISSGALPGGVSLGQANGIISGMPTTSGQFNFTVRVTDSTSPTQQTATQSLGLTIAAAVAQPPSVTTTSLPGGTVSTAYSATLTASGGTTPYSWSVTAGALPAGLSLTAATGVISGKPTASGNSSFTVLVKDAKNNTASKALSISIAAAAQPPTINTSSLPGGTVGTAYSATLAASGGKAPYSWSVTSGSLPTGLALTASSGLISGTPTQSGTFPITVQVKDSSTPAQTASQGFGIVIEAPSSPLKITSLSLPSGEQNSAYSATLAASGGKAPYSWSVTSGALPAGLALTASSGLISGTPTQSGTFPITVQAKDASSPAQTAAANLSVVIGDSSSGNCPTGQPCGANSSFCENYTPPSTSGATLISSIPYNVKAAGNYYLDSDLSSTTNGIYITYTGGLPIDINLNGHTITYGTTANGSGSTQIGEYGILSCNTGNLSSEQLNASYGTNGQCVGGGLSPANVTVENGTITQSTNASSYIDPNDCPGSGVDCPTATPHDTIASHVIKVGYSHGWTIRHLTLNFQQVDTDGVQFLWQQSGSGLDVECNTFNNKVTWISNRADPLEGMAIDNEASQGATSGNTFKYNTIVGGPQLGIQSNDSVGTIIENNDINLGYYQNPPFTPFGRGYSNDYAIGSFDVCAGQTITQNYIHNVNGRGIGCIYSGDLRGAQITNNYIVSTENNTNAEYSSVGGTAGAAWPNPASCEIDGARAFESKGSVDFTLTNNVLIVNVPSCGGGAAVFVDMPCNPGDPSCSEPSSTTPAVLSPNTLAVVNTSGGNSVPTGQDAACFIVDGGIGNSDSIFSSPVFSGDICTSDGDFFTSDTNPAQNFTFANETWNTGSHPLSMGCAEGFFTCGSALSFTGQSNPPTDQMGNVFQDFTLGGASGFSLSKFQKYAGTGAVSAGVTIDWTYSVTVQKSSNSAPISGASVSVTDVGNQNAICTTNLDGVCSVVLRQSVISGPGTSSVSLINENPNAVTISAPGCTTLNYNLSITGTTNDTKSLGGC